MARIRALAIVGTLALAAIVLVVVTMTRDTQTGDSKAEKCPRDGYVAVNLTLPAAESEVKINVFNATGTTGLATSVAADFRNRKFQVLKVENAPEGQPDQVAILRYGPKTAGAAHLLLAYFLNDAYPDFDIKRDDDVVDVIIGNKFKQLATPTEMRQAVAQLGRPELPPGTCAEKK